MIQSPSPNPTAVGLRARVARMARSRRTFFRRALGAAAAAAAASAGRGSAEAQAVAVTDVDILNFALNLEYLGSEYYTYAVTGNSIEALGLPTTGVSTGAGDPGPVIIKANPQVPFAMPAVQQYATDLAVDEQRHLLFIRNTLMQLGAVPVARPTLDLLNSYNMLAAAAGLPVPFDPFANDTNFLLGAYILEDVCVTVVHGAAPLIKSKAVLAGGSGLLGVESYHAAMIRTKLFELGQGAATQAISNVRRMLGGSVDYGVAAGPLGQGPAGSSSIVLADATALVGARTTRQVLNIVYGGVNAHAGLFFPNSLNGNIR